MPRAQRPWRAPANPFPMAKGYPVRPETDPHPECHNCGSDRLTAAAHGPVRCRDCGHLQVEDPFAVP